MSCWAAQSAFEGYNETMTDTLFNLVGQARDLSRPDDDEALAFYGALFSRLPRAGLHLAPVTRFLGYQSPGAAGRTRHLFGVEVEALTVLPEGLTGWSFGNDTLTRRSEERSTARPLRWLWSAMPSEDGCGTVGEFVDDEGRAYWLSAQSYFRPDGQGAVDDSIQLVEPDPTWPEQYAAFMPELIGLLGADIALRVEHYGSTAIPGIPAKPVLDILVEVPSFAVAKARAMPRFNRLNWDYWWHAEHMLFVRRDGLMGARTHHVHLAPNGHRLWEGLRFRDHLRAHPADARAYAALKRELAAAHGRDRERYTLAKTEFVSAILARAGA